MKINLGERSIDISKVKSVGFYDGRVEIDLTVSDGTDHEKEISSYDDFTVFFMSLVNEFNNMEKR